MQHTERHEGDNEEEEEEEELLAWPQTLRGQVWYVVTAPLVYAMVFTVPDPRRKQFEQWFVLGFALSIVWIALFSYLMV